MTKPTTIRLPKATKKKADRLAELRGFSNLSQVIIDAIEKQYDIQIASMYLADSDFLGLIAELYRPIR